MIKPHKVIKLSDILKEIQSLPSKYIGSCVDIGGTDKEVCKYFPNATILATYVGNPDEDDWGLSKPIFKEEFYKYISSTIVPKETLKGKHSFHYIDTGGYGPQEAAIFFIYNEDQDIHYFFKRGK
jgi:hypothetical protein